MRVSAAGVPPWSAENSELHAAWHVMAHTGMRRGELLALRWRDLDLDAGTIAVRQSVGAVRNAGEGAETRADATKTGKSTRPVRPDSPEACRFRS